MRLLGVLGLGLVVTRSLGDIFAAKTTGDDLARLYEGFRRGLDTVGPHIGDQTNGLAANIDAFIELLSCLHGALGREAELARGLLLQS